MVIRIIISGLIFLNCLYPLFAQKPLSEDKNPAQKHDKLIPIPRLIPGFDQIKNKKYLKGSLLLSSFAACICGAVIYNSKGNNKYDKYLSSTDITEIIQLREETETAFKKRNLFLIGTFSIWVIHLIDIKFFNKRSKIKSEVNQNTISFGIYFNF